MTAERQRLEEARSGRRAWRAWGPYLSERQWGTVREDYSAHGTAWDYLPHDHARSRAYRWGEDGIAGICDLQQRLCFAPALWNRRDPILKERLFGLTGSEGNHGEDVKEYYYYLDSTPTHSYMKALYKYPQTEFPYELLLRESRRRGKGDPEFELLDSGVFDEGRYFDVFMEYAKVDAEDILIRYTIHNRGPEESELDLIPQLWFRNTWSWQDDAPRPSLWIGDDSAIETHHDDLGRVTLHCSGSPSLLLCDNETNSRRLFGTQASGPFKDGVHDYLIAGHEDAVRREGSGTKAGAHYPLRIAAGAAEVVDLRLARDRMAAPFDDFDAELERRRAEADEFYAELQSDIDDDDRRRVQRQALAGMLWSKQFFYYDVDEWLEGDPTQPSPPPGRRHGRNSGWTHLNNADVISMPDKWEYPWYAAWDLAFHCIPLALVDADFAKDQLVLLTREWYMHPNGQLPAYEWAFGDVNPPVHAWATWRTFKIDAKQSGRPDHDFLERVFHKLLLNFTWWVNRKDIHGQNLFQGGFLGLDNIGVFDRSAPLPTGGHIEQADGTSWMAMYSLNMLRIALELSERNPVYQDLATKFFEHFLYIAAAMTNIGDEGIDLWDDQDEFFYDVLHLPDRGTAMPLRLRSMVGLIPLFAVETLEPELLEKLPDFARRMSWFLENRPDLAKLVSRWHEPGVGDRRLLSLLRRHRLKRVLSRMLDSSEFLSDYGVRALSRHYADNPFELEANGNVHTVSYQPAESDSGLFGGNSNWRGPIWFPVNFLIIESLQKFHHYYGDDFQVECPTGSGRMVSLDQVAQELSERLCRIFLRDDRGERAVFGDDTLVQQDPHFRDYILFHEYFHGDNGRGVGASHQTGWTGVVAKLLQPRRAARPRDGKKETSK